MEYRANDLRLNLSLTNKTIEIAGKKTAYLFNNDLSNPDGFNNNEVPLSQIEKLTGFTFK